MFGKRPDGVLVSRVPKYRRMMPLLMTTKGSSVVYSSYTIDMERALEVITSPPAGVEDRLTLTHIILWAATKTLNEYPELNRFVSGWKIYQRDGIWFSFSAKKAFSNSAPIVVIRDRFDPASTLVETANQVQAKLREGRSDKESFADKESKAILHFPASVIAAALKLYRVLDCFALLPPVMIKNDIFYSSAFIANLGSIGLDAAYHHLYEHGTIPIFMTIGKVKLMPVFDEAGHVTMRKMVEVKISLDERVTDGFYATQALERFKQLIENPVDD